MTAIYKKEMKSYMTSMTGAIAIAVSLLVTGLMFRYYNLYNGVLTFHYTMNNSTLMFYIVVPVLSMRVFAEERKQKTDQLLLTAPVSIPEIVFGKYLALISVFAIPMAVTAVYPLVMKAFGKETLGWDYACVICFFLMGCAYLAAGMFISSLTENVVIAAILSILFVFVTQMVASTTSLFSSSNFASLVTLIIVSVLIGLLVYFMTEDFWACLGTIMGLSALWFIFYAVKPDWFSGKSTSIIGILDFSTHFSNVAGGSLNIADIVYFASAAAVGIILTMTSIQRRRWS
ncbi:MAG: ABC transporter permease [Lachnospiraceae bacterium]|nr:ABC transporter permease [Lachnospiraceae bacterium]